MHELAVTSGQPKAHAYQELATQLSGLFAGERDGLANSANLCAVLYHGLPDLNWAGLYWMRGGELMLGSFQGKVACTRIALGKGVCGTAAAERRTLVVPDVHAFPGHIACDAASRSESVVPLIHNQRLLGVLDLDSPLPQRFDTVDAAGLETLVGIFLTASDFAFLPA